VWQRSRHFLTYDSDPYIVAGDDGRLVVDYGRVLPPRTSYPYSRHYTLGNTFIDYMRK